MDCAKNGKKVGEDEYRIENESVDNGSDPMPMSTSSKATEGNKWERTPEGLPDVLYLGNK